MNQRERERTRRHVARYRVLSQRFVHSSGVLVAPERRQTNPGEFERGDVFSAVPSSLLRRAVRDGDLALELEVEVERADEAPAPASQEPASGKRPARAKESQ